MRFLLMIMLLFFTIHSNGYDYGEEDSEDTPALNYTSIFKQYNTYSEDTDGDGYPQIISIGDYPTIQPRTFICDYFQEEYICYTLNKY